MDQRRTWWDENAVAQLIRAKFQSSGIGGLRVETKRQMNSDIYIYVNIPFHDIVSGNVAEFGWKSQTQ